MQREVWRKDLSEVRCEKERGVFWGSEGEGWEEEVGFKGVRVC